MSVIDNPDDYKSTKIKNKYLVTLKLIGNGEINQGLNKAISHYTMNDKDIRIKLKKIFDGDEK